MTITYESKQANAETIVYGGVDTHQREHQCAVVDADDRVVAVQAFAATQAGYRRLADWLVGYGLVAKVGVESTGGYGAGLTRLLLVAGFEVVEVDRPDRVTRARDGKSDPIDAIAAARAARVGRASGTPKIKTGAVESLRMIKMPRDSAVKDRTRAYGQLRDLVTTAPAELHDELIGLTGKMRVARAVGLRPDRARLTDPVQAAKLALRTLARRIQDLDTQIAEADQIIDQLTRHLVPTLLAMRQVGPQTAAQLVITAGENIDRMRNEASFAKLTGVAPLPASSGKRQHRHRLNRGGDRHANCALHMIIIGRLKDHQPTRTYYHRRAAEGLTDLEIIRCLKRHLVRSIYRALRDDLMTT